MKSFHLFFVLYGFYYCQVPHGLNVYDCFYSVLLFPFHLCSQTIIQNGCPVLNLPTDNAGEDGENKTGVKISLLPCISYITIVLYTVPA